MTSLNELQESSLINILDTNGIAMCNKIEVINDKSSKVIVVLLCQYYNDYCQVEEHVEEAYYAMDRLEVKNYELNNYLKEKEDEWQHQREAYEHQAKLLKKEDNEDNEISDSKKDETGSQRSLELPKFIANMPPALLKAIMDDQKDIDNSSSSIESSHKMSDCTLTPSERDILYGNNDKIEIMSFSDDASYNRSDGYSYFEAL